MNITKYTQAKPEYTVSLRPFLNQYILLSFAVTCFCILSFNIIFSFNTCKTYLWTYVKHFVNNVVYMNKVPPAFTFKTC